MSKERARRRAEREAAAAVRSDRRARQVRRRRRWTATWAALTVRFARPAGRRPVDSALGRRRQRQNGILAALLLAANAIVWLMQPSWGWRVSALVASVALWPVFAVLLFDRRMSR